MRKLKMILRPWIIRLSISTNIIFFIYLSFYLFKDDSSISNHTISPLIPNAHELKLVNSEHLEKRLNYEEQSNNIKSLFYMNLEQGLLKQIPPPSFKKEEFFKQIESNVTKSITLTNNGSKTEVNNINERIKLFPCDDSSPKTHYGQKGPFWVLYNYYKASKEFLCDESITYTTHADFTFLDNLIPLLERWEGPISLALYAPGTDFSSSIRRINYLRECADGSELVKNYVSFHIFFDYKHSPKIRIPSNPSSLPVNCSAFKPHDISFGENLTTYKKLRKLPYPVNVARNVARESSTTHYILPSDIELYPNPNLIGDFLEMVKKNGTELRRVNPNKVFVLSIFEVESNVSLPQDKMELIYMLKNKTAIPFHKYVCATCHKIPKAKEWMEMPMGNGLNVFHVGKRYKPYHHWEPIYIGTKLDPLYDERLSWEGRSDKMTQGYVLCVLDYEFHILDNAFLIHRPGIKRKKIIPSKNPVVAKQNTVIANVIYPELKQLYGTKPGCYI